MNIKKINRDEVVVALDIGTTKICAIAGRLNEYGKIEIVGVGSVKSNGVSRGVVSNIDKTVRSIREAVEKAERNCDFKFKKVHVGIAGQHIKSLHHHGILTRSDNNNEISLRDIEELKHDMHQVVLPPGDQILHVIPQEFTVDNERDIMDPIGMSGTRLEANFHIITGQLSASNNIRKCVDKAGLEVADLTLEPMASGSAVLSHQEKEAGVVLVDIGGGTTDITIFSNGIIRHTAVIPFGGNTVTRDIQEGCTVMSDQAEKLKVKFGSAMSEEIHDNRIITIPGFKGREHKEISEKNLARIIQARVEEIFDYVLWEIKRSGFENKLIAGIVLTGGGSLLKHINLLCELHTGLPTRIGEPVEHLAHGYNKDIASPIFATSVGLMKHTFETLESLPDEVEDKVVNEIEVDEMEDDIEEVEVRRPWYDRFVTVAKDFFEAPTDNDF